MEPTPTSTPEARMWASIVHLSALTGIILPVPLGNVLGPLVIWLIKKDEFALVDRHGKAALDFQLSMAIYGLVATLLIFVLVGIPLLALIWVTALVCSILATVKANDGVDYRYPLSLGLIR
jgi:uncharacterized protein